MARIKVLFPQQAQAIKFGIIAIGDTRMVWRHRDISSVDATIFAGSQDMSVTHQSLGRTTGETE